MTTARIPMPSLGDNIVSKGNISIIDLETKLKAGEQVFIRNIGKPLAWLVLPFKSPNGQDEGVWNIPATSIPFDICTYIPADRLLSSKDFRTFYNKGHIEYVPTEEAAKILSDSENVEALKLALNDANNTAKSRESELQKMREAEESNNARDQPVDPLQMLRNANQAPALGKHQAKPESGAAVAQRLSNLEGRAKNGRVSDGEVQIELRSMLGELTEAQLATVAYGTSFGEKIRDWAKDRLAQRK